MSKKGKVDAVEGKTPDELIQAYAKATKKPTYLIRLEFAEAIETVAMCEYRHSDRGFS